MLPTHHPISSRIVVSTSLRQRVSTFSNASSARTESTPIIFSKFLPHNPSVSSCSTWSGDLLTTRLSSVSQSSQHSSAALSGASPTMACGLRVLKTLMYDTTSVPKASICRRSPSVLSLSWARVNSFTSSVLRRLLRWSGSVISPQLLVVRRLRRWRHSSSVSALFRW